MSRRKVDFRPNRGSRTTMRVGQLLYPEPVEHPKTRGECKGGVRPCPFVSCRYHLFLDVSDSGSVTYNYSTEVWDMPETCALDVADKGEHTLDELAAVMNRTREAIRLVETKALVRFLRRASRVTWDR